MNTDPISDMLTRIRNASKVRKAEVRIPYSKLKHAIAQILMEEGYVMSMEKVAEGHGELKITLKYEGREPAIRNVKRVSKPGRRLYFSHDRLPRVLSDQGIAIVSTSQGVMSNKTARKRRLGGEVLAEVF
ncbi:30S ribosomal protein S8 [Candidatus Uhrbacteria bacterium]|nr:30S ribosomal protein S8 [Candidatus Uhrbacteria bacterium]